MVWYGFVFYGIVWCGFVKCSMVWYGMGRLISTTSEGNDRNYFFSKYSLWEKVVEEEPYHTTPHHTISLLNHQHVNFVYGLGPRAYAKWIQDDELGSDIRSRLSEIMSEILHQSNTCSVRTPAYTSNRSLAAGFVVLPDQNTLCDFGDLWCLLLIWVRC